MTFVEVPVAGSVASSGDGEAAAGVSLIRTGSRDVVGAVLGVTVAGPMMRGFVEADEAGCATSSSEINVLDVSIVAGPSIGIGAGMLTAGINVVGGSTVVGAAVAAGTSVVGAGTSPGMLAGGPNAVGGATVGVTVVGATVVGVTVVDVATSPGMLTGGPSGTVDGGVVLEGAGVSGTVSGGMLAAMPRIGAGASVATGTGSEACTGADDSITAADAESATANAARATEFVPFPCTAMMKTLRRSAPICPPKVTISHSLRSLGDWVPAGPCPACHETCPPHKDLRIVHAGNGSVATRAARWGHDRRPHRKISAGLLRPTG